MAKGAADAGQHPPLAVIGDSTFTHSGMTGLLDAVNEGDEHHGRHFDNLTTGMTGGQDSAGTGASNRYAPASGVEPRHPRRSAAAHEPRRDEGHAPRREIAYDGVSVIIPAVNAYRPPNGTTQPNRNNSDTPSRRPPAENPKKQANHETRHHTLGRRGTGHPLDRHRHRQGLPSTRGCTSSRPRSTA